MSGFRVGTLYSENAALHTALDNVSYFCAVSNQTQNTLATLLSDTAFVRDFLAENARRLREAYLALTAALREARLPYVPAVAGLFCMVDLREFLEEKGSWESERRLFAELLDCGVLMTPGGSLVKSQGDPPCSLLTDKVPAFELMKKTPRPHLCFFPFFLSAYIYI